MKFTHLPEIQNDFGNDPTNVMPFLLPKHLCYLFFLKEATGCVGKKSVQLQIHVGVFESGDLHGISYEHGHKLVMSGDNDNDDKPTDFEVPKPHKQNGFGTLKTLIVVASVVS